ncbi:MAG: AAA family ATPase [bacterium]|nr:AAA family ATPase [bacterium]
MDSLVQSMREDIEAGFQHSFIVTQNLRDEVQVDDQSFGFAAGLCRTLSQGSPGPLVVRYTLTQGVALYQENRLVISNQDPVGIRFSKETKLGEMLAHGDRSADDLLRQIREPVEVLPAFYRLLRSVERPTILVVDGAEYLLPPEPGATIADRSLLDLLLQWSRDRGIKEGRGGVVLLFPRRGDVPADLVRDDQGYRVMRESYPDTAQRAQFLIGLGTEVDAANKLANLTTGLRRSDLREVVERQLDERAIVAKKRQLIEARAGETIEFVDSRFGLDHANAQPHVKAYLASLVKFIQNDRKSPLVPMGILFVGVPGNGKSHVAKAFAHDCQMNMLRLKNIRGMHVGDSERNLETVLDLLPSLAPCVVFIDEVDQMMGRRSNGPDTDSGVERRLLGRLLAFMGDADNRGDIIWIGATNRPDLLDVAAPRRFERTFPFMNPTDDARVALISDIVDRLQIPVADDFDSESASQCMKELSCDDVEKVLRRAYENALLDSKDISSAGSVRQADVERAARLYRPNYDPRMHELIGLLSVRSAAFLSDLPWFDREGELVGIPPDFLRGFIDSDGGLDNSGIDRHIAELRNQLA